MKVPPAGGWAQQTSFNLGNRDSRMPNVPPSPTLVPFRNGCQCIVMLIPAEEHLTSVSDERLGL